MRRFRSARFSVPHFDGVVRRQRLLDFLHQHLRRLMLISAATGFGKSVLAADFAREVEMPVAWCKLDETDGDLAVLADDLIAALQRPAPAFQSIAPALAARPETRPAELAATLAQEMDALDDGCLFILDNFHLLESSPPALEFFAALTEQLPEQISLCLLSRHALPFYPASLVARQELAALGEADLRFTPDEIQAVAQARGQLLPRQAAEQLAAHTRGWSVGLLLTSQLPWAGPADTLLQRSGTQALDDYLAGEVLNLQPAPLQHFLLESAVLPEMDAGACDLVLRLASTSAGFLQQAAQRHLFVERMDSGAGDPVYAYHPLFREFLLRTLQAKDTERLRRLRRRAAAWYARNDLVEHAVTLHVEAGEREAAAHLAEGSVDALFWKGQSETLRRWAEQLQPTAEQTPTLYLHLSKLSLLEGNLAQAAVQLQQAAEGYAQRKSQLGSLRAELQRSHLEQARGEHTAAHRLALNVAEQAQTAGQPRLRVAALHQLAACQAEQAQLAEAEDSLRQALHILRGLPEPPPYDTALCLSDLSAVLRWRGQPAAALQHQALEIWRTLELPGPLAIALHNMACDLCALGQLEAAQAAYAEAWQWATRSGSHRLKALVLMGRGEACLQLGQLEASARDLAQAQTELERTTDQTLAVHLRWTWARLERRRKNYTGALEHLRLARQMAETHRLMALLPGLDGLQGITLSQLGNRAEGREKLEQARAAGERAGRLCDLPLILLFLACAEFHAGASETSAATLAQALDAAEAAGCMQWLAGEAPLVCETLEAFQARPDIGARVARLLALTRTADGLGHLQSVRRELPPTPHQMRVQMLGQARVYLNGQEIRLSGRLRNLLVYLLDRAPLARDELTQTFWPNKSDNNLHLALHRLRKAFGRPVAYLGDDQLCRLSPDLVVEYDVARFEAETHAALRTQDVPARLARLIAAIELYVGDYCAAPDSEWMIRRQQGLRQRWVDGMGTSAEDMMQLGRQAEAREVLARALIIEPTSLRLNRAMLNCLHALGQSKALETHYKLYGRRIQEELGRGPEDEIRRLYYALLSAPRRE